MPFVWSIGTIIGPFIGGTFSDPHDAFPNLFPAGGLFYRYPYLLPNLVCAALLFVSIILGYFLLEETHPDMQPRVSLPDDTYASEETPLLETSDAMKRPVVDLRDDNYGTVRGRSERASEKKVDQPYNIYTKPIMSLILALCIFTYHSMTYDHLLPIFFEDDRAIANPMSILTSSTSPFYTPGGLGISLRAVGMIMAVNGVIALFVQAVIFPFAAEKLGVYRLFIIVTVLHPIAYVMVPSLLLLPESLLYAGIYFCLAVRNVLSIILYPLLLILIKEATPTPKALGKVNGLAASAAAGFRMIAPPVAGWLYTFGSKIDCTALAWYGSAVVAVIGAIQCFSVKRERKYEVCEEEEAQPCLRKKESRVTITETFSDDE